MYLFKKENINSQDFFALRSQTQSIIQHITNAQVFKSCTVELPIIHIIKCSYQTYVIRKDFTDVSSSVFLLKQFLLAVPRLYLKLVRITSFWKEVVNPLHCRYYCLFHCLFFCFQLNSNESDSFCSYLYFKKQRMSKLMISYSWGYKKETVNALYRFLVDKGYDVWKDDEGLRF